MKNQNMTFEQICFPLIVYELNKEDESDTIRKIKRKLKYYGLQEYDEAKVKSLRNLHDELQSEISKFSKSKFFTHQHGIYSDLQDFNLDEMILFYHEKYPDIKKENLGWILNFAIFSYYLR